MAIKLIFMGLKLPFLCTYIYAVITSNSSETRNSLSPCVSHAHDYETMQKVSTLNSSLLFTISNPIEVDYHCWTLIDRENHKKNATATKRSRGCETNFVKAEKKTIVEENRVQFSREDEWDKSANSTFVVALVRERE